MVINQLASRNTCLSRMLLLGVLHLPASRMVSKLATQLTYFTTATQPAFRTPSRSWSNVIRYTADRERAIEENYNPQETSNSRHTCPSGQWRSQFLECLGKTTLCYQLLSVEFAETPNKEFPARLMVTIGPTLHSSHRSVSSECAPPLIGPSGKCISTMSIIILITIETHTIVLVKISLNLHESRNMTQK